MYRDKDLTKCNGSRPSIYGLTLASVVLTKDDIRTYCLSPKKAHKHGRQPFPPEFQDRIGLIKSKHMFFCINNWYLSDDSIVLVPKNLKVYCKKGKF